MSSIRFVMAGSAVLATALMGAAVGASAQTSPAPGKPLQLVPLVERSHNPVKPKRHVQIAVKRHRVPVRTAHRIAVPAKLSAAKAIAAVVPSEPASDPALAFAESTPDMVTVAGQSVQVTSPDHINELDRAADAADKRLHRGVAAGGPRAPRVAVVDAAPVDAVAPIAAPAGAVAAPAAPAAADMPIAVPIVAPIAAPAAPIAGDAPPVAVAVAADPAPAAPLDVSSNKPAELSAADAAPTPSPDGSWLAQVLAALGGAIAAAFAAWFLIRTAPQRARG